MRNKFIPFLSIAAGLGLMSLSGTASAAALTCITGQNAVTVNSASACAVTPGQNDQQVNENLLIFNPGNLGPYNWTYLDKDNRNGGLTRTHRRTAPTSCGPVAHTLWRKIN